jgi:hypothetical protein
MGPRLGRACFCGPVREDRRLGWKRRGGRSVSSWSAQRGTSPSVGVCVCRVIACPLHLESLSQSTPGSVQDVPAENTPRGLKARASRVGSPSQSRRCGTAPKGRSTAPTGGCSLGGAEAPLSSTLSRGFLCLFFGQTEQGSHQRPQPIPISLLTAASGANGSRSALQGLGWGWIKELQGQGIHPLG